ncbi:MAG: ABC transporter permease [Clostridiaceae bacterium]|nr:ABC transporter permease [Clostridiaceae bacterium]
MLEIIKGAVSLGLLWSVMTIGVYISFRILEIADLTVEGSITLGAAIAAQAITKGINPYIATGMALLGGMAAGLATGLLHTKLKIPALLSGILTMIALYSVNLRVLGKASLSLLRMETVYTAFEKIGLESSWAIIALGFISVTVVICFLYWFFGTEIGCAIRATGNNPNMVRAQGINTDTMITIGLVLSNGIVALSGAFIAQNQTFADVQMGTGSIVIGLASVIIGEVLFGKRNYFMRLTSLAMGAITYRIIIAFVLKLGMHSNDLKLFTAITVAIALSLPIIRERLNPPKITIKEGE